MNISKKVWILMGLCLVLYLMLVVGHSSIVMAQDAILVDPAPVMQETPDPECKFAFDNARGELLAKRARDECLVNKIMLKASTPGSDQHNAADAWKAYRNDGKYHIKYPHQDSSS